jgi:transposase InsO family protein
VTCSNEPWPSGSRRRRHREPLPLCQCPEGRWVPGSRRVRCGRVSTSAFYAWVASNRQGPSPANHQQAELVAEIRSIHQESGGTYGSPRIHAELARRGWRVNHKRVERLRATHGMVGHRPHRRRSLTKPDTSAPPAPDLLGRIFDPDRPDVAWCGDITYIPPTRAGCIWPVCWAWHPGTCWAGRWAAITTPGWSVTRWSLLWPPAAGSRWTTPSSTPTAAPSPVHRQRLHRHLPAARAAPLMGRTGSCLDNAVAQSWFATLKVELVDRCHYRTRAEARARSSPGSPGTTDDACIPSTTTCRPWSGNSAPSWPPATIHPGRIVTVSGPGVVQAASVGGQLSSNTRATSNRPP